MAFPRLCAFSEVVWSPKENRKFTEFSSRLIPHLERLGKMGVNYYRE
jgi:hexosaminidase